MKKWRLECLNVVAACLAIAVLTGCESSDSGGGGGSGLAGTWRLTGYSHNGAPLDVTNFSFVVTLRSDGTYEMRENDPSGAVTETGVWSATGNQLTVTETGEQPDAPDTYVLSGNTLTVTAVDGGDVEVLTFTRV